MTADGQTYERKCIEEWFRMGKHTSPLTNVPLPSLTVVPNHAMKRLVQGAVEVGGKKKKPDEPDKPEDPQDAVDNDAVMKAAHDLHTKATSALPRAELALEQSKTETRRMVIQSIDLMILQGRRRFEALRMFLTREILAGHENIVHVFLTEIQKRVCIPDFSLEQKLWGAVRGYSLPLQGAVFQGHLAVVRVLLEHGADVNGVGRDEKDPALLIAVKRHPTRLDMLGYLINAGAHIDMQNKKGITALMKASSRGHLEVVELLLEKGATIDQESNAGWTALTKASAHGRCEVVRLLLVKGAEIDRRDQDNGYTALSEAIMGNYPEAVELLLTKGAEINLCTEDGCSPVMLASLNGNREVVELLLAKGANIHLTDKAGRTPLIFASTRGHCEVVELFLAKGASIDHQDNAGKTAQVWAEEMGQTEVVRVLKAVGLLKDLAASRT